MVAHNPLHRSGRAVFPHPALALGDNAHATQGIRMVGANEWQPAVDQPPHPVPKDTSVLATPRKGAMPEPPHSEPEEGERRAVHGHSIVAEVSTHDRAQPLPHIRNGIVPTSLKLGFHLAQLRLQPFAHRLPQHREHFIAPLLSADVREAEEVERLRFPFSAPLPVHHREREDVRFSVEIRAALLMIISPFSGDPSGRLGLLEVGLQRGEKAGQSTIPVNAPELLLGNHKPGTHPAFDLRLCAGICEEV